LALASTERRSSIILEVRRLVRSWALQQGQCPRVATDVAGALSPDVHAIRGRQVQLISRLDVECSIPGVYVAHDSVDPKLGGAVRIREHLVAQPLIAAERVPALCPGEEQALVARQ